MSHLQLRRATLSRDGAARQNRRCDIGLSRNLPSPSSYATTAPGNRAVCSRPGALTPTSSWYALWRWYESMDDFRFRTGAVDPTPIRRGRHDGNWTRRAPADESTSRTDRTGRSWPRSWWWRSRRWSLSPACSAARRRASDSGRCPCRTRRARTRCCTAGGDRRKLPTRRPASAWAGAPAVRVAVRPYMYLRCWVARPTAGLEIGWWRPHAGSTVWTLTAPQTRDAAIFATVKHTVSFNKMYTVRRGVFFWSDVLRSSQPFWNASTTIRYDTIYLRALKSWRYCQLSLAHGTEAQK